MKKEDVLKLTLALYRVTDRFPEKEPLKYYLREAATSILAFAISPHNQDRSHLQKDLEMLEVYFSIAKLQNWVAQENILVLEREYGKIKEVLLKPVLAEAEIKQSSGQINKQAKSPKSPVGLGPLRGQEKTSRESALFYTPKERKRKIAEIIEKKERITLRTLMQTLPQVHRRTLIRDLENLVREKAVKKEGNGRGTFYLSNGRSPIVTPMVTEATA